MEDVPFSTQKNYYVFSRHFDSIFYCHPEIVRLMRNKNREQNHNPGKSEAYYLKKIEFFKENKILDSNYANDESNNVCQAGTAGSEKECEIMCTYARGY